MDAVTYPQPSVVSFIESTIVPLQVPHDGKPLSEDFNVSWTPTLITLDAEGREHHRTVGFLSPEELIPSLKLGRAKVRFNGGDFQGTLTMLDAMLNEHPANDSTPEAIYLRGVASYKASGDPKQLKVAWQQLEESWPGNEWTKKAQPYRLL